MNDFFLKKKKNNNQPSTSLHFSKHSTMHIWFRRETSDRAWAFKPMSAWDVAPISLENWRAPKALHFFPWNNKTISHMRCKLVFRKKLNLNQTLNSRDKRTCQTLGEQIPARRKQTPTKRSHQSIQLLGKANRPCIILKLARRIFLKQNCGKSKNKTKQKECERIEKRTFSDRT